MRAIRLLAICLLISVSSRAIAGNIYFSGIPLGTDDKSFIEKLEKQGFTLFLKYNSHDTLVCDYGPCEEYFYTGEIDGNPASVHITTSSITHLVFKVETVLREFIDVEEALDEADRLLSQIRNEHCYSVREKGKQIILQNKFIEMPGGGNRITKYHCIYHCGLLDRYYNDPQLLDKENYIGSISIEIYANLMNNPERIIVIDYFDLYSADLTEAFAGLMKNATDAKKAKKTKK